MNQPYKPQNSNRPNNRQGNRHSGRPSNSGKLFFRSSSSQDGDTFRGPRTPKANFMPRNNEENAEQQEKTPQKNCLRIIPLGGLGEVGRNMTVIEWRDYEKDDRDILLIDAGVRFPEEDMPGIDLLIPNIKYLEDKVDKISGLVFTHGHFDHIGALPYMLEKLENPMIYAAPLTKGLILKRHEEFKQLPKLMIDEIRSGDKRKIGVFEVEFIHINHSIPDDMALL
ncbi:MAG: ribonuclease J, partial [bacterium]|nr:ribonuclease J [bacterium]